MQPLTYLTDVAYHPYEGLAVSEQEQTSLVKDLGDKNSMILYNHGLLTCGSTIEEAFMRMYYLWLACKIQVAALSSVGSEGVYKLSQEVVEFNRKSVSTLTKKFGVLEFDALVRVLLKDDSYKR